MQAQLPWIKVDDLEPLQHQQCIVWIATDPNRPSYLWNGPRLPWPAYQGHADIAVWHQDGHKWTTRGDLFHSHPFAKRITHWLPITVPPDA